METDSVKDKILGSISEFSSLCRTMFKLSAGDFADENFPKIVDGFWEDGKDDSYNLDAVKGAFEMNRKLNERNGNSEAAKVIAVYQEGWLSKIVC